MPIFNTSNVLVTIPTLPAGTNIIGSVLVPASATVTGLSINRQTALVATAVAVKASAGRLYGIHVENSNSAKAYVQVYNVAQGSVTPGTTTPDLTFFIPGSGGYDAYLTIPISFATAITIAATTTATGGTAPGTGLLVNTLYI